MAFDDEADEMWKNVLMFQHLAHEAKTARAGGLAEEALRITGTYWTSLRARESASRRIIITTCEGDITQRANWQAFGARAAYGALLEGVLGLQWDMGGLYYAPAIPAETCAFRASASAETVWDVEVDGDGGYVATYAIDGQPAGRHAESAGGSARPPRRAHAARLPLAGAFRPSHAAASRGRRSARDCLHPAASSPSACRNAYTRR